MYKFGQIAPRALQKFGVSGVLAEKCKIYYDNLFSSRSLGRVSDVLSTQLKDQGLDEIRLRAVLLFGFFDAFGSSKRPLSEPLTVECGIDSEKVAVGIAFVLGDAVGIQPEGLSERIQAGKPTPGNPFELLLSQVASHADHLVVRMDLAAKRVEIVSLLAIPGKMEAPGKQPLTWVTIKGSDDSGELGQDQPGEQYIQIGDLDYVPLIESGLGSQKQEPASPSEGELLAKFAMEGKGAGKEAIKGRAGKESDESMRFKGDQQPEKAAVFVVKSGGAAEQAHPSAVHIASGAPEAGSKRGGLKAGPAQHDVDAKPETASRVGAKQTDADGQDIEPESTAGSVKGRARDSVGEKSVAAAKGTSLAEESASNAADDSEMDLAEAAPPSKGGLFSKVLGKLLPGKASKKADPKARKKQEDPGGSDPVDSSADELEESGETAESSHSSAAARAAKKSPSKKASGTDSEASIGDAADDDDDLSGEQVIRLKKAKKRKSSVEEAIDSEEGEADEPDSPQKVKRIKKVKRNAQGEEVEVVEEIIEEVDSDRVEKAKSPLRRMVESVLPFGSKKGKRSQDEAEDDASQSTAAKGKKSKSKSAQEDEDEEVLLEGKPRTKKTRANEDGSDPGSAETGDTVEAAAQLTPIDQLVKESRTVTSNDAELVTQKILQDLEKGNLTQVVKTGRDFAEQMKRDPAAATKGQWMEGFMERLVEEQQKLTDAARKAVAAAKKTQLEFKGKEQSLIQEARRREELLHQKNTIIMRTREQLDRVNAQLLKAKETTTHSTEDVTVLKQKANVAQRQLATAKEENTKLMARVDEMKSQLATVQLAQKSVGNVATEEVSTLKQKVDRLTRQYNQTKALNEQLMKKAAQAPGRPGATTGDPKNNADELKKRLDNANKTAAAQQRELEQFKLKLEEAGRDEMRLKGDLARSQSELKATKAEVVRLRSRRPTATSTPTTSAPTTSAPDSTTPKSGTGSGTSDPNQAA